jgi:hypothetical protein
MEKIVTEEMDENGKKLYLFKLSGLTVASTEKDGKLAEIAKKRLIEAAAKK